jgi:quinohemoprotein amine dehydrogenase
MNRRTWSCLAPVHGLLLGLALLLYPASARSQSASGAESEGSPIENDLVIDNCSSCHTQDDSGRMTRLSYLRKTPEGWQTSIRRMVALVGVDIEPASAREIVRYLSNEHGIAPEELRPGLFEVERRLIDFDYEADDDTETTCTQCHSMGRVITQRRTSEEWGLLMAMHRGYYPVSDFQAFRYMGPAPGSPEAPSDTRHPMDKAIEHLSQAFPLETPEWSDWSATMQPAQVAGTWAVSAVQPGYGRIFGQLTIEPVAGTNDEFTTSSTLTYARSGEVVSRSGSSIVYTGYQWRGSSVRSNGQEPLREVLFVERDWQQISGRWFTGDYDELGFDAHLYRVGNDPMILGMEPRALKAGTEGQEVRIFGANLPQGVLTPEAVDLGPGVTVQRVVRSEGDLATVIVDVDDDASVGPRDISVSGARRPESGFVYDQIHSIRVNPEWGMARVGGARMPKGFTQFEARAYHQGTDGRTGTGDDVDLGVVDATWSLEEYSATFDDDDIEFVGRIDAHSGLFTPAPDGPNPERSGNRNNIGDVWVIADFTPPGGQADRPLRARAHLIVTVPLYMRWDPWGDIL